MTTTTLESRFVFYQSFHDMIALIPDMETQLAAYGMICAYAFSEIEPQTDNWVLKMVFSAAKPLIDSNRKRRENGKKGGRKPATAEMQTEMTERKKETAPQQTMEPLAELPTSAPQTEMQPVLNQESEQTQSIVQDDILLRGENKYPVTQTELQRIRNFTQELFQKYKFGRMPNESDVDKVLNYTVARKEINGVAVGVLDRDKADLLEYAFEKAKDVEKLHWRYIEGMYRNFALRGITTGAEAYQYDLSRSVPAM